MYDLLQALPWKVRFMGINFPCKWSFCAFVFMVIFDVLFSLLSWPPATRNTVFSIQNYIITVVCLFVGLFVCFWTMIWGERRLFVLLLVELLIIIFFSWSLFYEIVLIKQCGQIIGQTILQQWWFPRYNWYMVESGAKHHNTDPNPNPCTSLTTITYQTLRRKTIPVDDCLQPWNMHWTGQRWTQPDTDKIFER